MSYKDAKAVVQVVYEGKDITTDLAPYIIAVTYRDKAIGEADELSIQMRDNAHLWKWVWNPKKGDKISAKIIQGSGVLDCGVFDVDTVTFDGERTTGHYVNVQALSAGVKEQVRTKSSFAHEGKTLRQIVQKYAEKYNYKLTGITRDFPIDRITQWHESDLAFLHRIAQEFGYLFTVKGDTMVFVYMPDLNDKAGAVPLKMADCERYRIQDKVTGVYVKGQNRYHNAKQKKTIVSDVSSEAVDTVDVYRSRKKVDNDKQGLLLVGGRLYKKNMGQVEIDATCPGNVGLVSGNNAALSGFFNYNGNYMIADATHMLVRDKYTVSAIYKKIVKNQDAATGEKKATPPQEIDITNEARQIYDALYLVITSRNLIEYENIRARVAMKINSALSAIRAKGDKNLSDLADEWQGDWNKITAEVLGGYGDVTGEAQAGFALAVTDATDLREEKVQPYTQKF